MADVKLRKSTPAARLTTMLAVDIRRMLHSRLFYILVAASLVLPVIILVMTTMMDGSVSVDPQTGKETVIEGFDNVWQIIGSVSGESATPPAEGNTDEAAPPTDEANAAAGMGMSLTSMCNVNLIYFAACVLVCIFVGEDFKSGYAKNIFTVRSGRWDYVISKTVVLSAVSALMVLAFFIGSMLGGAISSLSFEMVGFNAAQLVLCLLAKLALVLVFVPIYLIMSIAAKERIWLSVLLSLGAGMLLFAMIPMLTPLNASVMHPLLCLVGGGLFAIGLGAVGRLVLNKTRLV